MEIEASNEYSNLVSRRRIRSRGRAAESAQLSRAFLFLCTFPTPLPPSPPHSSQPVVPLPRGPVSSSSRVRSEHRVSGGRMSEETETHWHRFHTHFLFFYVWNIIKRGKRGGNRLRSSSECRALVTNGRWTDLPLRWPEMRLELESKCFSNVNSFVRSISSFNIIIVLCLLSRVETFFVDINISFLWSIDLSFD